MSEENNLGVSLDTWLTDTRTEIFKNMSFTEDQEACKLPRLANHTNQQLKND